MKVVSYEFLEVCPVLHQLPEKVNCRWGNQSSDCYATYFHAGETQKHRSLNLSKNNRFNHSGLSAHHAARWLNGAAVGKQKENTVTLGSVLMSWNIYFKNWKNKNKPTNIVLVYHTKIYFNVAMWVFVSLWLQCEAVWKAGWAQRTTDTQEERLGEELINGIWAKTQPNVTRCAF